MKRREFIAKSGMILGVAALPGPLGAFEKPATQPAPSSRISFKTSDVEYQRTYTRALDTLSRNTVTMSGCSDPVLIEGSNYAGIWLECAPHEGLVYADIRRDVARNNHLAFFALQKEDGQIPCWSRTNRIGFAQIQMVVPIAATAWELSQQTGDSELLEKAYVSCGDGTGGCGVIVTHEKLDCAKDSAAGTQDTTTAHVGQECLTIVRMAMPANVRQYLPFLDCVQISRQLCTEDASLWLLWHGPWEKIMKRIDGWRMRTRSAL